MAPGSVRENRGQTTIDASEAHAPILPFVDGQVLDHAGDLVNDALWTETLDGRRFSNPLPGVNLTVREPRRDAAVAVEQQSEARVEREPLSDSLLRVVDEPSAFQFTAPTCDD